MSAYVSHKSPPREHHVHDEHHRGEPYDEFRGRGHASRDQLIPQSLNKGDPPFVTIRQANPPIGHFGRDAHRNRSPEPVYHGDNDSSRYRERSSNRMRDMPYHHRERAESIPFGARIINDTRRDTRDETGADIIGPRSHRRHGQHRSRDRSDFDPRCGRSTSFSKGSHHRHIYDDRSSRSSVSSDYGDSDRDERRSKRIRHRQVLTTGLAAVATIHAAHSIYKSIENRHAREEAVEQGRLDPAKAKQMRFDSVLRQAASVAIAAIGIKGAISDIGKAREQNHLVKEWQEEKKKRHEQRLRRSMRASVAY